MNKLIHFIKFALFIGEPAGSSIGLSQFKIKPTIPETKKKDEKKKEIKLSDLMRKN